MGGANKRILALFDVDGTLSPARGRITPHMDAFMKDLKKRITVGIVGGSDLKKQMEQLGESGTLGLFLLYPKAYEAVCGVNDCLKH